MNTQEDTINWILSVAEKIQDYFKPTDDSLINLIESVVSKSGGTAAFKCIASENYSFIIITSDPKQLLFDIGAAIRDRRSPIYASALNPISITTGLADHEYKLDANGTQLCYAIKSPLPSNYLLKSIACNVISMVSSFGRFVNDESNTMVMDMIKEIHPLFDYRTKSNRVLGGKKKTWRPEEKRKGNIRMEILSKVMEYVRNDKDLASSIIFISDLAECNGSAMNIIYTDHSAKDNLVGYIKTLVSERYSFKSFLHADFKLPHDFRLKKYSCILNDKDTNQPTYLMNMYNTGTYAPVPCIKNIDRDTYIHIAHPIVRLRFLYIDMFMIEQRVGEINPIKHEQVYLTKMVKVFNELETFDRTPLWVGKYIDTAYAMIRYNMQQKANMVADMIYV
jgi:hypothetical protein